jgi:hypothetical protein
VKQENARVVGGEPHRRRVVCVHNHRVAAHRYCRRIGQAWEVGPAIPALDHLKVVPVQVERMCALVVVVDLDLDDRAIGQDERVGVRPIDGRVIADVGGGRKRRVKCWNLERTVRACYATPDG